MTCSFKNNHSHMWWDSQNLKITPDIIQKTIQGIPNQHFMKNLIQLGVGLP